MRAIAAARAAASSGEPTPVRPRPVSQSTSTPSSRPASAAAPARPGSSATSSAVTEILARRRSCASCSSFRPPTRLYGTRTSSIPASAITSASCSVWQVMPVAPSSICRRAISTHLCVFTWGRLARPTRSQCSCQRARLRLEPVEIDDGRRRRDVEAHAGCRARFRPAPAARRWRRRRRAPRRRAGTARRGPPAPALAASRSARRA